MLTDHRNVGFTERQDLLGQQSPKDEGVITAFQFVKVSPKRKRIISFPIHRTRGTELKLQLKLEVFKITLKKNLSGLVKLSFDLSLE